MRSGEFVMGATCIMHEVHKTYTHRIWVGSSHKNIPLHRIRQKLKFHIKSDLTDWLAEDRVQ